ncbi:NADPH:quinone reductase-like Zn-dependent oxidoreductase [Rhodopseudomonas julia]|uniref:NADPH:quinone reductase-like Zn-dependent oxidoreductase n=1 Tax=Rhodopseudomonas julia TaxID=200617 RepID=A0ABU0C3S1_9BRAD|nr:NADP-dependent oxidoreductase [Rhodopseudomonas julia]MDQ0324591.1 NADPH:quinone reductase-like Zn-dependent oxidoreductase [Rhodopseudomonas julia]
MKAVIFSHYGGAEVLRLVELEKPRPGPGEVRIKVSAAGVNPSDWKRRKGLYREFEEVVFPSGVGVEAAGVVDAIGPAVSGVTVGDAVFGYGRATVAEYACLSKWVAKPSGLPCEVAGGLAVTSETALRGLDDLGMKANEWLLISGAAGGIGAAAVQFARHRGIIVIGTASERNQAYLQELGAIPTTYGPGLAERVRALAPHGIDAAFDVAGSGIISELIGIVGVASRVVSVADLSAEKYGARFSKGPPREPERVLAEVAKLYCEGQFQARVERTFSIEQTAEAHAISEAGHASGKLVICMP